jgi:N-acetylglucosamine-6-phosphate deacetylase
LIYFLTEATNMIIQAASGVVEGVLRKNFWLEITNNTISHIEDGVSEKADTVIEGILIPGFVDIHCHGGGGAYFSSHDPEDIDRVIEAHKKHGTTSLLASLVSEPIEKLLEQIKRINPYVGSSSIKGIHLEGPYLSHARCGAHNPTLLRTPSVKELQRLLDAGQGNISMITLAPELEGALDAIDFLVEEGVVVALGHTEASAHIALEAIDYGATIITHFTNGMPKLGSDAGTITEVALADDRLSLELILDGTHIKKEDTEEILALASHRSILVTDAISAAGGSDGHYKIGELDVDVTKGVARLTSNKSLAGSTLTMDRAFLKLHKDFKVSIEDAVNSSSALPAGEIGMGNVGEIALGMSADLLELTQTGEVVVIRS